MTRTIRCAEQSTIGEDENVPRTLPSSLFLVSFYINISFGEKLLNFGTQEVLDVESSVRVLPQVVIR